MKDNLSRHSLLIGVTIQTMFTNLHLNEKILVTDIFKYYCCRSKFLTVNENSWNTTVLGQGQAVADIAVFRNQSLGNVFSIVSLTTLIRKSRLRNSV